MPSENVSKMIIWPKQSTTLLFTLCFVLFCLQSKCLCTSEKIHRLTAGNGTLLSAENFGYFVGSTSCIWEIEVPKGYRIKVNIRVLEIKASCYHRYYCPCTQDYVEFRDGLNSTSPSIGRYCANNKPINVYSTKNVLRVRFFSSARNPGSNLTAANKFRADYSTVCGQFIRGTSGEINSHPTPNLICCLFTIVVPYGWVMLKFTNISVGKFPMFSDSCYTDFIMVKQMGLVEYKDTIEGPGRLCGQLKSLYVFSRGRELSLLFQASMFFNSSFAAKFEATNQSIAPCGGFLANDVGYIYSYRYPKPYPRDIECIWKIEVQHGFIKLAYLEYNFTVGTRLCLNENIEVYDGWSSNAVKIRPNCGRLDKRPWLKSQSNRLLIKARSKNKETGTFLLSYELVEEGLCMYEEFGCTSRECINLGEVCDGAQDCSDGSDELNCPKKKQTKALYVIWVLIVFIASILMVIWLWRTWRSAVNRTVHFRQNTCPEDDNYVNEIPSENCAPPTYNEALNHAPTTLPSYEEALLNDNGAVIFERGNTVRFLARSDSTTQHLLPGTGQSQPGIV